jgi:hypothetical protein
MAAGSWSDGIGFALSATLIVSSQTGQTVTGFDASTAGIGQISYLDIRPLFSGSIGSAASPLKMGASTRVWNAASGGTLYLQAANDTTGGSSANTIALYQHSGQSTATLVGGTFTQVQVSAGVVTIGSGTVVTTLRVSGGTVTVEDNATAITTYECTGSGKVIMQRQITTGTADGLSTTTYDDSGAITTCTVGSGATWNHLQGNITTAVFRGTINTGGLKADATFGGTSLTWWNTATLVTPAVGGATLTQSNVTNILGGYQAATTSGGGVPIP